MQINISARHGHLSDDTQAKIMEKMQKLSRFHDRLTAIEVTVDLEHREAPDVDLARVRRAQARFCGRLPFAGVDGFDR